jgi:hypothetical protein
VDFLALAFPLASRQEPAAFLILLATPARAGIVAPDLGFGADVGLVVPVMVVVVAVGSVDVFFLL